MTKYNEIYDKYYKSYKYDKKLLQMWERQTNKQTKTKQTKRLITI